MPEHRRTDAPRPDMERGVLAGVDIGGTKIAVGLTTPEGRTIATCREATAPAGGEEVVAQVIRLLNNLQHAQDLPIASIGIAVPAVVDAALGEVVWAPKVPGWQSRVAVAGPVEEALQAPCSLHYDGHALVTGEWWLGVAQGARHVALVAVGTGIGGGLILDGKLHRGRVGVAGAVGWWVPDWRLTGSVRSRSEGWLESFASGPGIARAAQCATAEETFTRARKGDRRAQVAIAHAAQALGAAVAGLVSLVDPEVVVLAGGVIAGGADLILPTVQEVVCAEAQPQMAEGVRVVAAGLGEEAGWLGAARLGGDGKLRSER